MKYIIDRIEETYAVCEDDEKNIACIPISKLPADIKEGDILIEKDGIYAADYEGTLSRRKQMKSRMFSLFDK